jgi:hypothetical protein
VRVDRGGAVRGKEDEIESIHAVGWKNRFLRFMLDVLKRQRGGGGFGLGLEQSKEGGEGVGATRESGRQGWTDGAGGGR